MNLYKSKRGVWLLAGLLSMLATSAAWADFNYYHTTDDSLSWRSSSGSLGLDAVEGGGLKVSRLAPATWWGLRQGDLIETVDGRPLRGVSMLLARFGEKSAGPLHLGVRREGVLTPVVVAAADYAKLAIPAPPPPPAPPAPPAPPEDIAQGADGHYLVAGDDLVSWHDGGERVMLVADAPGVAVVKLQPASLWGLRRGDLLAGVNGKPVQDVPQLLRQLRALGEADARLDIRRANTKTVVVVPAEDYQHLLNRR